MTVATKKGSYRRKSKGGKAGQIRRCLGPGPEHTFRSPDPAMIRICNACKKKTAGLYYKSAEEIH